ncbi:tyrosine-type recombinase/integrase [Hoyosella sp. YIM 151337]|uniref:tyrosine-type recombinase/integrase n=1 Tax=Hoyosella sp. YIM 151337 TaxID=2992742 RepID=UPI0022360E25|nr:tyrosine-type recombinase/integrase [Hoyosella sp. YIM 151337]MCW4354120.1 tyrosine-type recombinase/integrase [Hoyosella sp. YIM 151337]
MAEPASPPAHQVSLRGWARRFLDSIASGKPSPHTLVAYQRDLDTIIELLAAETHCQPDLVGVDAITVTALRGAFAAYAVRRSAATVRRTWSAWNRFCGFLLTENVIPGNPMQAVNRPKTAKTLPRSLPDEAVARLVSTLAESTQARADDWPERDFAIIALTLLCGLRSAELLALDIRDHQIHPDAVGELRIHVRGKGRKDRIVHTSPPLTALLEDYLTTRTIRVGTTRRASADAPVWARFKAGDPMFVNLTGQRLTQGTLQYRVQRAYRRAGIEAERTAGALTHALRHTFATTMARNPTITVHTLAKMLGHESIATTQRYTEAAGTITRHAAATNPHYKLM